MGAFGEGLTAGIDAMPEGPVISEALEQRFGGLADFVLGLHGLVVDRDSRARLLVQVEMAATDAVVRLKRAADGDYAPDKKAERFPAISFKADPGAALKTSSGDGSGAREGPTWEAVIAAWERQHEAADKQPTVRRQARELVERFAVFVGKPPIETTKADVRAWIEERLAEGLSPTTLRNGDIVFVRAMWKAAQACDVLPDDATCPAVGVSVPRPSATGERAQRSRRRGYSDDEARSILSVATEATEPLFKFVPLLLATSGARVSEVVCLRAGDVRTVDGVPCFSVDPAAGRHVKTAHSIRDVPLHPAVIEAGFVEWAAGRAPNERLFFRDRPGRRGIGLVKPGRSTVEKLRRWLRDVCPTTGSANGVDPNHAWRHRLKTKLREAGVDSGTIDALCGHAPASVGAAYGAVTVRVKVAAVAQIKV